MNTKSSTKRLETLDALRGLAMVWMTIYHFSFDLNYFDWIQQDFYRNPIWTWQRSLIVSLFLFCVGWSQAANVSRNTSLGRSFWRRWWQITGCAGLVTLGSYAMFPHSFIYFGVLHGIGMMLLILLFVRRLGQWLWLIGTVCMLLFLYPPIVMNTAPWNILGLISHKPITEDYVPLLPWFAWVCWGYVFGIKKGLSVIPNPFFVRMLKPLAFLGRYSLRYYMLHQPILIGLLWLLHETIPL
jgi:uncharacterized membrane protein